jgi:membrane fusion protein (multidrug efflux system)
VYVVTKANKVEQRLITIAAEQPYVYIVKSGLKDDDKILIEGLRRVHNGQTIEINYQKPESVLSKLNLHAE